LLPVTLFLEYSVIYYVASVFRMLFIILCDAEYKEHW